MSTPPLACVDLFGVDPFDVLAEQLFVLLAARASLQNACFVRTEMLIRPLIVTLYDAAPQSEPSPHFTSAMQAKTG